MYQMNPWVWIRKFASRKLERPTGFFQMCVLRYKQRATSPKFNCSVFKNNLQKNIKMPGLSVFENKNVSQSQSNQVAKNKLLKNQQNKKPSQIKEYFQGKDQVQGGPITSCVKISERCQVCLIDPFKQTKHLPRILRACLADPLKIGLLRLKGIFQPQPHGKLNVEKT